MNSVKHFMTISEQECSMVYPKVIAQANQHFNIAETLASAKHHGSAISHLILGAEEMIKAIALLMETKGFHVRRIRGVSKLFNQHAARHHLMRDLFSVWLFARPFIIKWIETSGHYTILKADESGKFTSGFAIEAMFKVLLGWNRAKNNFHWWIEADNLKQKGFYSDYKDDLHSPEDLHLTDYQKAARYISRFRDDGASFISWLENIPEKRLIKLRENFMEAQFPEIIEQMIFRKHEPVKGN